jgi:hypothetical protein
MKNLTNDLSAAITCSGVTVLLLAFVESSLASADTNATNSFIDVCSFESNHQRGLNQKRLALTASRALVASRMFSGKCSFISLNTVAKK